MTRKQKYRRILLAAIAAFGIAFLLAGYETLRNSIPDEIHIERNGQGLPKRLTEHPLVTISDSTEVSAGGGSYFITCSVADTIPLKTVKVVPEERRSVQICGSPVGIYMETDGVMVVDTGQIQTGDGLSVNPAENIVKSGDYILSINGQKLSGKRDLQKYLTGCDGSPVTLLLNRNGEQLKVSVTPVLGADGGYKIGIWVRDNIQGIGTLTYVESDGSFGALGHAISDVDTGKILNLKEGELYLTEILSVIPGQEGCPGELQGVIHYEDQNRIGVITENSGLGIHGVLYQEAVAMLPLSSVELGYKQEMEKGPARVVTCVDGQVKSYEAEITDIDLNAENSNKSFCIRITDPELLSVTGGIVQGMSGSPVIQNGRFVGAVTHVFVQDAAKGYGIFAETMLGN